MMDALEDAGVPVVKFMNETKLAAMFDDANLNSYQEKKVCRHIRDHFGKKCLATEKSVWLLGEGHTKVKTGKVFHQYTEGERPEQITFSYKDIPVEIKTQVTNLLRSKNLNWRKIKRIDIINGGDHGAGAFQWGCQIVIIFEDDTPTEIFDLTLAEVICRKDNALMY